MGHKPHTDVWGSETADVPLDDEKVCEDATLRGSTQPHNFNPHQGMRGVTESNLGTAVDGIVGS